MESESGKACGKTSFADLKTSVSVESSLDHEARPAPDRRVSEGWHESVSSLGERAFGCGRWASALRPAAQNPERCSLPRSAPAANLLSLRPQPHSRFPRSSPAVLLNCHWAGSHDV